MSQSIRNIFVTGATGVIGNKLVIKLEELDYQVYCLVRNTSNFKPSFRNAILVEGTLENPKYLDKIPSLDCIIHIAAKTPGSDYDVFSADTESYTRVNTKSTEYLIEKGLQKGLKRFIYISTHSIVDFDDYLNQHDPYVHSKFLAEEYIKKSNCNWTIIRPSGIYGKSEYWIKYLESLKTTEKIKITGGNSLRQFIFSEDVTDCILLCLNNKNSFKKIYNVAGKNPFTLKAYYETIRKLIGAEFKIDTMPTWPHKIYYSLLAPFSKRNRIRQKRYLQQNRNLVTNNENAQKDFHYNPKSITEGLTELIREIYK